MPNVPGYLTPPQHWSDPRTDRIVEAPYNVLSYPRLPRASCSSRTTAAPFHEFASNSEVLDLHVAVDTVTLDVCADRLDPTHDELPQPLCFLRSPVPQQVSQFHLRIRRDESG